MSTLNAAGDSSLSEGIGKRLMTPGGSVAPGVAPELFPCVVLENDRVENRYLSGERAYARAGTLSAGGAGTRASITLLNARPDTVIVVERVRLVVASGLSVLRVGLYPPGVLPTGSVSYGVTRDTRQVTPAGILGASSGLIIADATLSSATFSLADLDTSFNNSEQFVLAPGGAIYLSPDADNVAISRYAIYWRERRLNPSERS